MKKVLTAKTLDALKGKEKRYDVHDLLCPGFSVRVSENGRKVFSIKYRFGIEQKRVTLGIYPRISLATAREKAMDILRQVDEGIDPTKQRRRPDMKVESVCRQFIRLHAQGIVSRRHLGANERHYLIGQCHTELSGRAHVGLLRAQDLILFAPKLKRAPHKCDLDDSRATSDTPVGPRPKSRRRPGPKSTLSY